MAGDPEALIRDAFHAALALIQVLKDAPPADPEGYALVHRATVAALEIVQKAAPYWRGQAPDWAPDAASALGGIVRLGQRLTCLAAAAVSQMWDHPDLQEAITSNWPAVQRAVAQHYRPVPCGVLESALQREARETAERPPCPVLSLLPNDGGFLDQQLTAYELLADAADMPSAASTRALRPRWVRGERTLFLGDQKLHKYRREAPRQFPVLDAFERAGWPESIPIPAGIVGVKDTVESLNTGLEASRVQFHRLSGDTRIGWSLTSV
jgi:hypothetical protein